MTLLGRPEREVLHMPLGHLLDQVACYMIFHGLATPRGAKTIEEIMPSDVL